MGFKLLFVVFFAIYLAIKCMSVNAQGYVNNSAISSNVEDNQSPLNNGVYYKMQKGAMSGTAYLNDKDYFLRGKVIYDGYEFLDVLLMYDLVDNVVVTSTADRIDMYRLINEKVSEFHIDGHHFINVNADNLVFKSGFFELIHQGDLDVLIKLNKAFRQTIDNTSKAVSYYDYKEIYYVKKDNIYYHINSLGSFFNLLKEEKKYLKRFVRERKIKFKDDPKAAILALVFYYETLTK